MLVDGVDLGDLDAAEMRQAIRIVGEEPFLFADTLAENLLLGGHGDEVELRAALTAAAADDVVDGLEGGLDGSLGDRGLTLSGGQRQRIALACALVRLLACSCSTTRSAP